MANRARLSAPQTEPLEAPHHHEITWAALPAQILMRADRRMEAENYLSGGYGIRLGIESQPRGWVPLGDLASIWQPSRLKGIQVGPEFGTPFLAATQVFELRPSARKWLALKRTQGASYRFVERGSILVTCSGSVGKATLAYSPHLNTLITHDLLRVKAKDEQNYGWIYAFMKSTQAQEMMASSQYGRVIKHLEVAHLSSLPIPLLQGERLESFNNLVRTVLEKRDLSFSLVNHAENLFSEAIGEVANRADPEEGFEVKATSIFSQRRRLDASYHSPRVAAIVNQFKRRKLSTETLSEVTERIWLMARVKRIPSEHGMPYLSAEELFSINPKINKRVIVEQDSNTEGFYVKAGWIVMTRSGQTYGLLGSVALITGRHENVLLSDDLIRIIPKSESIHPGYLFTTLGHPKLGRPLLLQHAYGTSIPHLEPKDISAFPVVRLGDVLEEEIGELMSRAAILRSEADEIENNIASQAEELINRFVTGDFNDLSLAHI
jgi:type I restriction enzyme, S subunit